MDLNKSIRMAVDTGKVLMGADKTVKAALNGTAKLIVIASNCPIQRRQDLKHYSQLSGIPVLDFKGTSIELGTVCGKPFPVSAMSVLDAGNSDLLDAAKK